MIGQNLYVLMKIKQYSKYVLLFYILFFILFSNGRLSSSDAGTQLQASMLLANTGSLGIKITSPEFNAIEKELWLPNVNGVYYQVHDIGNTILMMPSALAGSILSKASTVEKVKSPPIISRFIVSMTYAGFSAIACFFMFKLFALFYPLKPAFFLSFAFATTTFFWPYTKAAWDVLGACNSTAILLYISARVLVDRQVSVKITLLAGLILALVCSFRYSLTPFLVLSLSSIFYFARSKIKSNHVFGCFAIFLVGMVPTLTYNYVRMGSPFRPATSSPEFAGSTSSFTGNIIMGLYGLVASPNRGILIFAPIFILLFILPFLWIRLSKTSQKLCLAYGGGAILYVIMIAKLPAWGAPFGWGPRYLVPILPILFFMVGIILAVLWEKHWKPLMVLISFSFILNLAPVLVNWHLALTEVPDSVAINQNTPFPAQHIAVWRGVLLGIQGKPLPAPQALLDDPIRSAGAKFPDLWTVRIMERSKIGLVIGLAISLFFIISITLCFRQIVI